MESQIQTKIIELLQKSKKPFIALPSKSSGDAIGAGLGLYLFLEKLGKRADICCAELDKNKYSFLPHVDSISNHPEFSKSFVISVNTSRTKVKELSYVPEESQLNIFLKPSDKAEFKSEDISFRTGPSDHDLIICINVQSLDQLGDIYTQNTDVFFGTPQLNIDNNISNENYGALPVVDVTSSSNSEIIFSIIKDFNEELIDSEIATALLAGVISATNSFQHVRTTPQSFFTSSELINRGGRQQEIIQHLFKTKQLSVLKLWGRAMARIKSFAEPGVLYSGITQQDLERSQASESDMEQVLAEMMANIPDLKLLFLSLETSGGADVWVYAHPHIKISEVVNNFGGTQLSENSGQFKLSNIQFSTVESILESTVQSLKQRLGL